MSAPRSSRGSRRAGFTLIETLVALVVFAVVAVVAQRGMVTARLGLDRVRSTLAAEQVARSLVETELDRLVRAPGDFTGQTNGLDWTISASLLPLPIPIQQAPARPQAGAAQPPGQGAGDRSVSQGAASGDGNAQDAQGAEVDERQWRALRVIVTVANGRGRPLRVETVQTVKLQQ